MCTGVTTHVVELASGTERFSRAGYIMRCTPDGLGLAVARADSHSGAVGTANGKTEASTCTVEIVAIPTLAGKQLVVPTDRVMALAFSPDGSILAVVAGWRQQLIRLYSVADGREIHALACPATRTHPGALAFAHDCRSLAVGLDDTTVLIWDVRGVR
jgi:WD40 repeat protein